jgi:hypothetical protein
VKNLNISKAKTSKREMSAKAWDSKMRTQRYIAAGAQAVLDSAEASEVQKAAAAKDLAKSLKAIAALEEVDPSAPSPRQVAYEAYVNALGTSEMGAAWAALKAIDDAAAAAK